jgi:hypothetical protein
MKKKKCSHCLFALFTPKGVECVFSPEPLDKGGNCIKYKRSESMKELEKLYKKIPCPYCLGMHRIKEVEWNDEDVFWAYLDCPEVGEVRIEFQFQDKFKRKEGKSH